jgi:hypothetical protein
MDPDELDGAFAGGKGIGAFALFINFVFGTVTVSFGLAFGIVSSSSA